MYLKKMGLEVIYLIHMAEDRGRWWALVNTRETSGFVKCGDSHA